MAFDVEDGTGKSSATSLVSVATADTYWTDRGGDAGWTAAGTSTKQAALVRASDYLRNQKRYRWVGTKKSYAQSMPWPRTDAIEWDGLDIPSNVVPWPVVEACCWLAARALTTDLQPALERGGKVASESVGPISTSYQPDAPYETLLMAVDGLLATLLRDPSAIIFRTSYVSDTSLPDGYKSADEFSDPPDTDQTVSL